MTASDGTTAVTWAEYTAGGNAGVILSGTYRDHNGDVQNGDFINAMISVDRSTSIPPWYDRNDGGSVAMGLYQPDGTFIGRMLDSAENGNAQRVRIELTAASRDYLVDNDNTGDSIFVGALDGSDTGSEPGPLQGFDGTLKYSEVSGTGTNRQVSVTDAGMRELISKYPQIARGDYVVI